MLTTGPAWRWRTDASGAPVGSFVAMLRQFEQAQRIRDMFFAAGSPTPQVRFTVTPSSLDAGSRQFLLKIDGQNMIDNHGPARAVNVTWPGARPMGAATFEERGGMRVNIVAEGTWAWFRLLDSAQVAPQTDVSYLVTFAKGGHEAKVTLNAASVRNPFGKRDLQQFRCAATDLPAARPDTSQAARGSDSRGGGAAGVVDAGAVEAFIRGLDARDDKKWQEVVTQMRSAIQADSQESTIKVRSGFLGLKQTVTCPTIFSARRCSI